MLLAVRCSIDDVLSYPQASVALVLVERTRACQEYGELRTNTRPEVIKVRLLGINAHYV